MAYIWESLSTAKESQTQVQCFSKLTVSAVQKEILASHLEHRVGLQEAVFDGLHLLAGWTGHRVVL